MEDYMEAVYNYACMDNFVLNLANPSAHQLSRFELSIMGVLYTMGFCDAYMRCSSLAAALNENSSPAIGETVAFASCIISNWFIVKTLKSF